MASSSTGSSRLAARTSQEGLKHLYRTLLQQARLLSTTLADPVVYTSHRFLARKNLEPLLTSAYPCARKRLDRAEVHRRQLADANVGWEHAVFRALSLAYARHGKLRRDALSDLSPCASTEQEEHRYPRRLRQRHVPVVLQGLMVNANSMNGTPVRKLEHLTGRPPPPYLPALDDPLVTMFARATSRRRVANAARKFFRAQVKKVKLPIDVVVPGHTRADLERSLFAHLERLAQPPRVADTEAIGTRSRTGPYLSAARKGVGMYRSSMSGAARRKRALRMQGWASHPTDYTAARARRRIYGRLLYETPLLVIERFDHAVDEALSPTRNDPLGVRARLRAAERLVNAAGVRPGKVHALKSRFAVGARGRSDFSMHDLAPAPTDSKPQQTGTRLSRCEIDFLTRSGLL